MTSLLRCWVVASEVHPPSSTSSTLPLRTSPSVEQNCWIPTPVLLQLDAALFPLQSTDMPLKLQRTWQCVKGVLFAASNPLSTISTDPGCVQQFGLYAIVGASWIQSCRTINGLPKKFLGFDDICHVLENSEFCDCISKLSFPLFCKSDKKSL